MKILVTGAQGQLGRALRQVLEEKIPGRTLYTDRDELDVLNAKEVATYVLANDVTHIVNCAAYTAVDLAEEEKSECSALNVTAVENIAAAAEAADAKVIHISTDYVFDGTAHLPYRESDTPRPLSVYGSTKRRGETALIGLAPESIIVRTAWLYSPWGRNFVKSILKASGGRKELRVVADQIGTPTFALDLARAIMTILLSPQWVPGIFHFSDEGVASWYDFAVAIIRLSGRDCRVTPITTNDYPSAAQRPAFSLLDKSRVKATYGVEIPHWHDSLEECLRQMKEEEGGQKFE